MTMLTINETQLNEVLAGSQPVLVAFTATWCGPCHLYSPILRQVADERRDQLQVVALDSDENLEAARRFQIQSVPTVIVFVGGQPQLRLVGARTKPALLRALDDVLLRVGAA